MKNILFVIFFLKTSLKNLLTSYPRAWWSLGSQDPLSHPMSPCLRLTGEGPLMPKEPGGKEIRGWRALGSLERTSCTCLGRCKTRCSGKTWSHVDKTGKKIQIFPTNMYACMYTHVYMWFHSIWNVLKAEVEVEDMDAPWMEGWTLLWAGRKPGHTKKEKLGTCEMIIILLCQLYMRRRKI